MDCNSIVYDAYRELEEKYKKEPFDIDTLEHRLIQRTITKICEYIDIIEPSKCVFITFDGVAPFAKMDQQRIRRYKTQFTNQTINSLWNTTAITPGTPFMSDLSSAIYSFFTPTNNSQSSTYKNKIPSRKIMVSCSDEEGEGEHKLFHYLRNINAKQDMVAVYGLDADLIMLSLFHTKYTKNIYVFREAPTFKTVLSSQYNQKELLFMDINALTNSIFQEMGTYHNSDKSLRVTDYVFMCFLLGNDFLPHFPALNIRTHGIQILTDTYYQTIGKYQNRSFIHPTTSKIQWNYVRLFLEHLAKHEHEYLSIESRERNKWDKSSWPTTTPIEKDNFVMNIPVIYRTDEKYICPEEYGWEQRYYKRLLHISSPEEIKTVCINYLEGLEWVFSYYTSDCPDWRWKYNYSYPPLLTDLIKYIPQSTYSFMTIQPKNPFRQTTQLAYVLPPNQLHLIKQPLRSILNNYYHLYPIQYDFQWAYCRYFWEAHPILPDIPLKLLDEFNKVI